MAVILPQAIFAQYANRLYDVDSNSEFGYNIRVVNDTGLFIHGAANTVAGSAVLFSLKLNASRNEISHSKIVYPGSRLVTANNGRLRQLADGTYATGFSLFTPSTPHVRARAGFMKMDANGDTIFTKLYTDTFLHDDVVWDLIEMPDHGFMLAGERYDTSPICRGIIWRLDNVGNKIWEREYVKAAGIVCTINSIQLLPDSRILMGAALWLPAQVGQYQYTRNIPWFVLLDTMGNMLHDIEYSIHYSGSTMYGQGGNIFKDKNGGYFHWGGLDSFIVQDASDFTNQPHYVAHLDTNFQIVWIINFANVHSKVRIWQVKQLSDSGYLAVGVFMTDFLPTSNPRGWAARISKAGTIIWQNYYTVDFHYDGYLVDAIERPDKSFLLVGTQKSNSLPSWHLFDVWLVGIDSNGCIMPGCNILTSVPLEPETKDDFSLYPNPTSGQFTIHSLQAGHLYITNILGQQVCGYTISPGNTVVHFPSAANAGVYTGKFVTGDNKEQKVVRISYQP